MKLSAIILLLTAIALAPLYGGEQITLFGNIQKTDFRRLSLSPNEFTREMLSQPLSGDALLRVCESIDNSEMVVFGASLPPVCFANLFDQPAVRNSLKELLRRDGMLYFSPLGYDEIGGLPKSMRQFFLENHLPLINHNHYKDLKNAAGKETVMKGVPSPGCAWELKTADGKYPEFLAVRHLNNVADIKLTPLIVSEPGGFPLAAYAEGVLDGHGLIFYNDCYNVPKAESHPLFDFLVAKVYGERRILSKREIARAKLGSGADNGPAASPVIPDAAKVIDLSHPAAVALRNQDGQETARATVKLENKILTVDFEIPGTPIKNTVTARDDQVWTDDFCEVSIASGDDPRPDRYQFIANASGVLYDGKNDAAAWQSGATATALKRPDGWSVRFAIPLAELNIDLGVRPWFRLNLGYASGKALSAWQPTAEFANPAAMGFASLVPVANLNVLATGKTAQSGGAANGGLMIWSPKPMTKIYTDTFAKPGTAETGAFKLVAARNEREDITFAVTNTSEETLYFRLEPQLELAAGVGFRKLIPAIYESIPWRTMAGDVINEPMLVNNGVLNLAPLETRLLTVTVKSDLPAGQYHWKLAFVPVNAEVPGRTLDFAIELLRYRFPDRLGLFVYTFGPYITELAKGQKRQYYEMLRDYHVEVIQTNEGPFRAIRPDGSISDDPADYRNDEALLTELGLQWVYGYGVWARFKREMENRKQPCNLDDPAVQEKFRRWLTNWAKTLHADGVDFNRFMVPVRDEPRAEETAEFVKAAKFMKQSVPEFRLVNTIATWTPLTDAQAISGAVDVTIDYEPRLASRASAAEELAFLQKSGKPFYSYLCAFDGNAGAYLDYFRHRGIRAFLSGTDGFALWSTNSWRGNPWDNTEDVKKNGAWLVMNGSDGPTPTRRFEMFREGAEDLFILREAARSNDPELRKLTSPECLQALLDGNRGDREEAMLAWREAILRGLDRTHGTEN